MGLSSNTREVQPLDPCLLFRVPRGFVCLEVERRWMCVTLELAGVPKPWLRAPDRLKVYADESFDGKRQRVAAVA
jgi:hypothetical protein